LTIGLIGIGDAGAQHGRALHTLEREGLLVWSAIGARDATRIATFRVARC